MDNLKDYTKTELLHFINDSKEQHEKKKSEIRLILEEIKVIDKKLDKATTDLDSIENMYVKLMDEYTSRQ